jgi:hypothetical protein
MRRRRFPIIPAICLLLCGVVTMERIRTSNRSNPRQFTFSAFRRYCICSSEHRQFAVESVPDWHRTQAETDATEAVTSPTEWGGHGKPFHVYWRGYEFVHGDAYVYLLPQARSVLGSSPPRPYWKVEVPQYVFLVLFGLPVLRELQIRFSRRHIPGTCVTCGYDLRASTERCPECGTEIVPAQSVR